MPEQAIQTIPGTDYRPEQYTDLLNEKSRRITQLMSQFDIPEPAIFSSPRKHYRMRSEFRVWHTYNENNQPHCHYAMFEKQAPKTPVRIDDFPIAHQSITHIMHPLLDAINQNELLSRKLFQVEFLSSTINDLLVTLIYHKPLEEDWQSAATALQTKLNISVIGRSRKQRLVLNNDHVREQLSIGGKPIQYLQPENSFTQPNAAINQKMIEWVISYLQSKSCDDNDLLELYCGNGNFTLPLAKYFRKVLATEISKTSIRFAKENCSLNNINNIEFVRLSGEETAQALKQLRPFRRLSHLDLNSYNLNHVLVDPPRAGLDDHSLEFTQTFPTIIYISCNPNTLTENLKTLTKTHSITEFALFDQFPYTDHCECGVILNAFN